MTTNSGRKPLTEITQLSAQHKEAARLLADGFSGKQVAHRLGVREMTISKWLNKWPTFQREVRSHQALQWAESEGVASKSAHAGLILCARVIGDESRSTRDRLQAASIALNHRRALAEIELRSRQVEALQRRLEAIEQRYREAHAVDIDSYAVHELGPAT